MKVLFWHNDKAREQKLAAAFIDGLGVHGDSGEARALYPDAVIDTTFDVACMVGVKSKDLIRKHARAGIPVIYFDKGYCRHKHNGVGHTWEYWRTAVGGHQPTSYLMNVKRPRDRWKKLGIEVAPWRDDGTQIVFAGSSAKYHDFYDLEGPTAFATKLFDRIKKLTGRPIIYRPKPSWRDAEPIKGTKFSEFPESITAAIKGAHVLITHGSNSCFEALIAGVPCLVLGDAVARPISSTSIDDVESPLFVHEKKRQQWLNNLAYCQWTMDEMSTGEAWSIIKPQVHA